jgi:hypothetical protein
MVIEPLLGTELKDKIDTDLAASSLSGLYLELFTDYIKPITKFEAAAQYLEIAPYQVDNGGVYKHAPANAESVDTDEVQNLANGQHYPLKLYFALPLEALRTIKSPYSSLIAPD